MVNYWYDIAGECDLYRIYDKSDRLLYVGVSRRVQERFKHHSRTKPWWPQAHSATITRHATRAEAFRLERQAITNENPVYNIARPKVVEHAPYPDDQA